MDRGDWRATGHVVTELDMTEKLTVLFTFISYPTFSPKEERVRKGLREKDTVRRKKKKKKKKLFLTILFFIFLLKTSTWASCN